MNVRPPQVNGGVPSLADASDNESPRPEATRTMRALAALGVFPGSADQVHRARRFTAGLLDGLYIADDAVICVSELATNAVLHSASREAGGTFSVHLETIPTGYIRIAVRDEGGPWARREHNDGRAHGLDIVAQLASDFGVGGDADHGWTVWARLNMTESLTELPGSAANGHAGRERADADATSGVMLTLADELTAQGLDVWSPRWDGSEYLKLTNG